MFRPSGFLSVSRVICLPRKVTSEMVIPKLLLYPHSRPRVWKFSPLFSSSAWICVHPSTLKATDPRDGSDGAKLNKHLAK